ncbi:ELMO1-like protein [Mya arenaria]|uniref:ELMO1-like protein n=1 Tax=Mya arenaria TaxID=6604 RepID=A0ABY7EQJ6_MYAAR|nr:ELMO1-like protein [Mya arenaria]
MNRDRSQSVQQLNLSRHVSSQLSYPGTSNTKSCLGAVGGSSVKADTENVTNRPLADGISKIQSTTPYNSQKLQDKLTSQRGSGDPLMYLLRSFVALMEHNLVSWDILEPDFTKQVTSCISGARSAGEGCTQPALEILENVILHSTDKAKMETLDQHITADKIIPYLRSHSKDVQQCALAVINAMFMKSSQDKKQKLMACFHSKTFRNDITEYILPGEVITVNKTVEELRRTAFDFSDIADSNTGPSRKSGIAKDLKKLGFTDQSDPVKDFETAPPGLLALDNMIHFAQCHKETYIKVLSVVREQITRALDKNQMPKSFDAFKSKLVVLAYPELKKIWDAERQRREESKAQAKPILELREMIKPEILELVRKHRLTYLEGGTRFHKYDNKGSRVKNKYQYWRLSANHKAFFYGDCEDKDTPALEQLPNKLAVHEIMEMVTGKNCAHVKQARNKLDSNIAFSLVLEGSRPDEEKCFHFSANSEQEYMLWEDGINALLNNPMTSRQTKEDMDILLNMEIKLRLLETEGITIPKEPPPIPPLPENYNFAYTQA